MSDDGQNRESPTIKRVFGLLDKWRHLPHYQLERRADVFFALFLREALENHFKHLEIEINPIIVPELPLKKSGGFQSKKADYFAWSSKGAHSFIIELKTDMSSVTSPNGKKQKDLLKDAAKKELKELICDVIAISKSKYADRQKYVHLLWHLQKLGLVSGIDEELCRRAFPKVKSGIINKGLANVKVTDVTEQCPKPKVVYIQPESAPCNKDIHCVSFTEFADVIENGENGGDPIGRTFAFYLKEWARKKAGSLNPQDLCTRDRV